MTERHSCTTLQTRRLLLRPFGNDDAPTVARMADDAHLSDTLFELPRPYGIADAHAWIDSHATELARGRQRTFAVCLNVCGTLVGCVSLRWPTPDSIRAELGYWTGPAHVSRGYASEAARAVIAFGFDSAGLERVEARHLVRNPASGRVMHKAGMTHEATLAAYLRNPHTGDIEDMEQWSIGRTTASNRARAVRAEPSAGAHGARIATVAILVQDYDAARDWFIETLGCRLVEDAVLDGPNKDGAPKRWLCVAPPGGGPRLLLARASSAQERAAVGRQGGGRVWLFLETDDFAHDHARLVSAGVLFDEAPRYEEYGTVAVFRDVCGNPWDLIQPVRAKRAARPPTLRP